MKWIVSVFFLLPGWNANEANVPLPRFEAAQVVPSPPEDISSLTTLRRSVPVFPLQGGPGTDEPGQLLCQRCQLSFLVRMAYEVPTRVPDWMYGAEYDLVAKIPFGSTSHQVNLMMQDLLIDRFHIEVHHQTMPQPGIVLSLGKEPPKLQPAAEPQTGEPPAPIGYAVQGCIIHLVGHGATLTQLAEVLSQEQRSPAIDQSGLTGRYDFDIAWLGTPPSFLQPSCTSDRHKPKVGNDALDAIRHQLRLKVSGRRVPGDSVVVDSALRVPIEK